MLLVWIAVPLFIVVGIAMIVARKHLLELHAIVMGGTALPGCVIAEAVTLFALAAAILAAHRMGMFR